jgi:glycosyltransferase involved in cell wall biosynthesis
MDKNNPLVCLGIPCYNYAHFLGEAIESALNQTYKNIEITVINDGSTDNTIEVARQYPVKLVNQNNQGITNVMNRFMREVFTSEYCVMLSADDKFDLTYVEKTMKVLMGTPEISFVYTNVRLFGAEERIVLYPEYNLALLKKENYIHGSVLMRKSHFMQTEGFDPTLAFLEDWDLWLSFAEKGFYGKLLPEPLLCWRRHSTGSRNVVSSKIAYKTRWQIITKHRNLYTLLELFREGLLQITARLYSFGINIGLRYLWRKSGLKLLWQRIKMVLF